MTALNLDPELRALDRSIEKARIGVYVCLGASIVAYVVWFCLWKSKVVGEAPTSGGSMGDFFGGVLNPIISFAAFYWLTKAVRLQKQELAETKSELAKSSTAQVQAVRISALTALVEAHTTEISYRRDHLAFLMRQKYERPAGTWYSMRGKVLGPDAFERMLLNLNTGITVRKSERDKFALELREILGSVRPAEVVAYQREVQTAPDDES